MVVLGLSVRIGTLPAARNDTHGTSSRCTVRGTVPCRAVGSVLTFHCHLRTVDFELILCRQVGDKFLFAIELSGFPAIHQSTVSTISAVSAADQSLPCLPWIGMCRARGTFTAGPYTRRVVKNRVDPSTS